MFVSVVALTEGSGFLENLLGLGLVFAVAGAGCASGSLILARRAQERGSLEPGEHRADRRLSAKEAQKRLGDRAGPTTRGPGIPPIS